MTREEWQHARRIAYEQPIPGARRQMPFWRSLLRALWWAAGVLLFLSMFVEWRGF